MEENRKKDGNIIKEFRRGKIISLKTQKRTIRNEKTKNSPSSTEGKSDTPIDNKQESRIMNDKEMFNLNSDEWIILDEWNKNDSEPTENEKLIQELNKKSIFPENNIMLKFHLKFSRRQNLGLKTSILGLNY